jgi:hypothetical protein
MHCTEGRMVESNEPMALNTSDNVMVGSMNLCNTRQGWIEVARKNAACREGKNNGEEGSMVGWKQILLKKEGMVGWMKIIVKKAEAKMVKKVAWLDGSK